MKYIKLLCKLGYLSVKGQWVRGTEIGTAYTKVSKCYEAKFLSQMHTYNDQVLEAFKSALPKKPEHILDLACGTGYNSMQLRSFYKEAEFCLVDVSKGMLEQAQNKSLEPATFRQQDMLSFLKTQPDGSFDGVLCCWAIKYQPPRKVIEEVHRVLKPGGVFGVIVNTRATLPEIRRIYPKLLLEYSSAIQKVMLELPNPKNKQVFDGWFTKQGFRQLTGASGEKAFRFKNEKDLAEWVTHTGALAGFDCMLDLQNEKIQTCMCQHLRAAALKQVTHTFVWGLFEKEKERGIL
ncbi:MAG: class I SAM-dependent methyltransferase [Niameybacter sp.]|uniref:class I SAM-dependent methyltransferase n=1 Tax=Niameybacter sp. TaxID=2033640 RepID=UPI002FC5BE99